MNKKNKTILLCGVMLPFLIGAAKESLSVKYLNEGNKKIVDFSKAIEFCRPGGNEIVVNQNDPKESDGKEEGVVTEPVSNENKKVNVTEKAQDKKIPVIIIVEHDIIKYQTKISTKKIKIEELEEKIMDDYKKDKETEFIIDCRFAYVTVGYKIEEKFKELGITYSVKS